MAKGDSLPSSDTVARYCFSEKLMGGLISVNNFKLRSRDQGKLSTTWVECPSVVPRDFSSAITRLPKPSTNGCGDLVVFLKVSEIKNVTGEIGQLDAVEDPSSHNVSHSAILNSGTAADPNLSSFAVQTELAALANKSVICSPLVR